MATSRDASGGSASNATARQLTFGRRNKHSWAVQQPVSSRTESLPKRMAKLACLLALAFVASFHLCKVRGMTQYEAGTFLSTSDSDNTSSETNLIAVDICHICTVVAASGISVAMYFDRGPVPALRVTPLVSVSPKNIGPPPRA